MLIYSWQYRSRGRVSVDELMSRAKTEGPDSGSELRAPEQVTGVETFIEGEIYSCIQ